MSSKTNSRYYIVTDQAAMRQRLVRAKSPAQALRYVTATAYKVEVAGAEDIVSLLAPGSDVEAEIADAAE